MKPFGIMHDSMAEEVSGFWPRWLKASHTGHRLFVGLIFILALSLFFHFRKQQKEVLELGKPADRYVVAQVEFEFADDDATSMLKQESLRDVGAVFKVDPKQLHQSRLHFQEELVANQNWRERLPHTTFEELHKGAKILERVLLQAHLTDPRTHKKMKEFGLDSAHYFALAGSKEGGITELPARAWKDVEENLLVLEKTHPEAVSYIVSYFEKKKWHLEEDQSIVRYIRQKVESSIPPVHTKISAGNRIIDPKEVVTTRHIDMLKAMHHAQGKSKNLKEPLAILGSLLLSLMFAFLAAIYMKINHRALLQSSQKLTLLVTIVILTFCISKGVEYLLVNKAGGWADLIRYPLFVPVASLLICALVGTEVALFLSGFLSVALALSLAVDYDRFLVVNILSSFVIILCSKHMHKRKEVFVVLWKAWLACIPVMVAFSWGENILSNVNLLCDFLSTFAFLFLTAILVVSLLPLLESLFKVMTDMTLMEYMDPNNELLRRLSLEAPGTYQHSLVLGNLAEAAARAIRANGLFCRVATLYHDIGKLFNPHYFTENQLGGFNIHPLLTPQESAQVIIAHVTEGEALARRYRLPQSFIDIIKEHHGTTLVYYFYCKQKELLGKDCDLQIDQRYYRYPGPKPHTKESAIIMIADTIEAASRSMDDATEAAVTEMVDRLIDDKAEDGQFDECQLSFEELGIIKRTMIKTLIVSRHLRVKYPVKEETTFEFQGVTTT